MARAWPVPSTVGFLARLTFDFASELHVALATENRRTGGWHERSGTSSGGRPTPTVTFMGRRLTLRSASGWDRQRSQRGLRGLGTTGSTDARRVCLLSSCLAR
jgi:hypothetical protein